MAAKDKNNMDPPINDGRAILHAFAHGARLSCLYNKGNGYGEGYEPWGAMIENKDDVKGFRYAFAYTPVVHHTDTLPYTRQLEDKTKAANIVDDVSGPPYVAKSAMYDYSDVYSKQPNKIRWTFNMSGINVVTGQQVLTDRQEKATQNLADQLKTDVLRSTLEKSLDAMKADELAAAASGHPWSAEQSKALTDAYSSIKTQQDKLVTARTSLTNISSRITDQTSVSNDNAYALIVSGRNISNIVSGSNNLNELISKVGITSDTTKTLVADNQKSISSLVSDLQNNNGEIKAVKLESNKGVNGFFVSYINEYDSKNALDDTTQSGSTSESKIGSFNWGIRDTLAHTFFKDTEGDCGYITVSFGAVSKVPAPPDINKTNIENKAKLDSANAVLAAKQKILDAATAAINAAQALPEGKRPDLVPLYNAQQTAASEVATAQAAVAAVSSVLTPCPTVLEVDVAKTAASNNTNVVTTVYKTQDNWQITVVESSSSGAGSGSYGSGVNNIQITTRIDPSGNTYTTKRTVDLTTGLVKTENTYTSKAGGISSWPVSQMSDADYSKTSYNMKDISDQCMFVTQLITRRNPLYKSPNNMSQNSGIALTYDEISLYKFPELVNECVASYDFLYFSVSCKSPFAGINLSKIDKNYCKDLLFQYKVDNPYKSIFGKRTIDNDSILHQYYTSSSTSIILTKWVLEINVYIEAPSDIMFLFYREARQMNEGDTIALANPCIFNNNLVLNGEQAAQQALASDQAALDVLTAQAAAMAALAAIHPNDPVVTAWKAQVATATAKVATDAALVKTGKPYPYEKWEIFYLQRACWGYHFFRKPEDILCFGNGGQITCYPTLEDYEGLTKEKLNASLDNKNRDHNSLFEDDYNYAYYRTNEPTKYTDDAAQAAVNTIDQLFRDTDLYKKPYTLFTPHITSHNTMTFLFSDSQDISNFPITLDVGTRVITKPDGTQAIILALPGIYPIKMNRISEEPGPDGENIFKELITLHSFDAYQADYPTDNTAVRKGISKYLFGYFNYDSQAVKKLISPSERPNGVNEFIGSGDLTSNYVVLTKEIKKDTTIYVSGTVARNRYLRQVVQTHTRFSNDRLRLYKEYIWSEHEQGNFGKPGTDFDNYNCIKPKSLVETFNFVVRCHSIGENQWEEKWRISELLTNARWIHRRWLKQKPSGDSPLLSESKNSESLCWAADTQGIILLKLNFDGTFSSSVIVRRENIKDKEWFQAYLDANKLDGVKLTDQLYAGIIDQQLHKEAGIANKVNRSFSEVFTSGMLFDISDTVNANVPDNKKIPYLRCFALAINLIKSGNKVGIQPLDLLQEIKGNPGADLDLSDASFAPGGVTAMRPETYIDTTLVNPFNNADTAFYDFQCYQSYLSGFFRNAAIFKIPNSVKEELRQKLINNPDSSIKAGWDKKIGDYQLVNPDFAAADAAVNVAMGDAFVACSAADAAWQKYSDALTSNADDATITSLLNIYTAAQNDCNIKSSNAISLRASCPPAIIYRRSEDDINEFDQGTWPCASHSNPCSFFDGADIPPGNHLVKYSLRNIDPTEFPFRDMIPWRRPDWVAPLATYYKAVPPCSPIKRTYTSSDLYARHLGGPMGAIIESEADEVRRKGVPLTHVVYPAGYPFWGDGVKATPELTTLEQLYETYYEEEEIVMPDVTLYVEPLIIGDTVQDNFTGVKWVTLSNTIFIPVSGNLRAFIESFGIERDYDTSVFGFEYTGDQLDCFNIFTKDKAIEYLAFETISDNNIIIDGSGIYTSQTPKDDNSYIVATDWAYNSVRCHEVLHNTNDNDKIYESWKVPHRDFKKNAAVWNTGATQSDIYDIWKTMVTDKDWVKHEKESLAPKYAKLSATTSGELFSVFSDPVQCTGKDTTDTLTQIKPSFVRPADDLTKDSTNPNPITDPSDDPDVVRIDNISEEKFVWKRGRAITCQNGLWGKTGVDPNYCLPLTFAKTSSSGGGKQFYKYLLTKNDYAKISNASSCPEYPWVYMSALTLNFTLNNLEHAKVIVCSLGSGTERILTVIDLIDLLPYADKTTKSGSIVIQADAAEFGMLGLFGEIDKFTIDSAKASVLVESDFYKYKLFNQNALRWRHKKITTTTTPGTTATSGNATTTTTETNQILVSPKDDNADVIDKIRLVCGKFNNTVVKDIRPTVDDPQFWPFPSAVKKSVYQGTTRRYALAYGTPIYDAKGRLFVFYANTRNNISAMMSLDKGITWYLYDGLIRLTQEETARGPFTAYNDKTNIISLFYLYKSQNSSAELLCVKHIDASLFQVIDTFVPYYPVEKLSDLKDEKDFGKTVDPITGKPSYIYSEYGRALRSLISTIVEGNVGKETGCGSEIGLIQGGWGWSKVAYQILSSDWSFYERTYTSKYAQLPKEITDHDKYMQDVGVARFRLGMDQSKYVRDIRYARYGAYRDWYGRLKLFIVWEGEKQKDKSNSSGVSEAPIKESKVTVKACYNDNDWVDFPEDFIPHKIDSTASSAQAAKDLQSALNTLVAAQAALAAIQPNSPDAAALNAAVIAAQAAVKAAKSALNDAKKYNVSDFTNWYFLNAFLCSATNKWGEVCACVPKEKRTNKIATSTITSISYIDPILCEPSSQGKTSKGILDATKDKDLINLCKESSTRFGDLESISIAYNPLTDDTSLFFGYTKTISVRRMSNNLIDKCISEWKSAQGADNTNIEDIIAKQFNLNSSSPNKPVYVDGKLTDETSEQSTTDPNNKKTVRDILEESKYLIFDDHGNPSGGTTNDTSGVKSWLRVGAYYNRAGEIRLFLFNDSLDILEVTLGADLRVKNGR